jgi:hypothetical protein
MNEINFGPDVVVALGAQIFADIMSSTQANAALQAIREDEDRNLPHDDCVQILAKNCIDYADSFAKQANKYLQAAK